MELFKEEDTPLMKRQLRRSRDSDRSSCHPAGGGRHLAGGPTLHVPSTMAWPLHGALDPERNLALVSHTKFLWPQLHNFNFH